MNKVIQNLIEQIVDLKLEIKGLNNYKFTSENKLKAADVIISNLKQEITNMRLGIDELQK